MRSGTPGHATLQFGPLFQTSGTSEIGDSITRLRFIVSRVSPAPVQVIANVVQDFRDNPSDTSGDGPDSLTVSFPLQGDNAEYEVVVKAVSFDGDTLYRLGPLRFTAGQISDKGGVRLEVTERSIVYVGPGSEATKVVASQHVVNLTSGQSVQLTATAFGPGGAALPRAVFEWFQVTNTGVAFTNDRGMIFAGSKRGTETIGVRIASALAPSDAVVVNVSPGPSQIQLVSGGNQSATSGVLLANPVVVKVVAQDGVPVPGATVQFAAGSGSVSPASVVTASDGTAQTRWTLGSTLGTQTLNVTVPGFPGSLQVQATATQAALSLVSGNGQSGIAGQKLAQPVIVQVFNGTTPVSGTGIVFTVTGGGGSVSPSSIATDASGRAQTNWTLGSATGTQTLSVIAAGASGNVTVTATATPANQTVSFVSILPTALTTGGTATITVQVLSGTVAVSGTQVTFTSSGSGNTINPVTATTGANGQATTQFSSTVAETKTITATIASASAQTTLPVVGASLATKLVKVSGDSQTVHYGTLFSPHTVQALDAQSKPVAGALIDWGTSDGNKRLVTDANGKSTATYSLPNDPVNYPPGRALTIAISLVGTTAQVIFIYFAVP